MQENSFISTKNHDVVYNHLLQDLDQESNKYIWQSFLDFKTLFTSMKELSVKDKPADRLNIVVKLEMKTNDVWKWVLMLHFCNPVHWQC